jgi:Vitamin K-dependent gamma-carboxylase
VRNFLQRLLGFLFFPDNDAWLSILRFGAGLQVICYCLSLRHDWSSLFAANENRFIGRDLAEAILSVDSEWVPRIGWFVGMGSKLGMSETAALNLAWIILFLAGCALICGIFCRLSAVLAWLLHLAAVKSAELMTYGMDNFTSIALFYVMIGPLPDRLSLDVLLRNKPMKPAELLGFFHRVLQIHLCIIYFFSGVLKCAGPGWWNGSSIWRALTRPPFDILPVHSIASFSFLLAVAGIATWLLETTYPIFIWPKRTRKIWLAAIIGMHLAIGITMGLYLFSVIMIVLNVAAFGPVRRDQAPAVEPFPESGRLEGVDLAGE